MGHRGDRSLQGVQESPGAGQEVLVRIQGEHHRAGAAHDLVPADETVDSAVGAVAAIVSQHEVVLRRHFKRAMRADAVAVTSGEIIAMIRRKQEAAEDAREELSRMAVYFSDMDLVLAEGYKQAPFPKIEIFRNADAAPPVCARDRQLIALVSDIDMPVQVPRFGLDDIEKLVDFIQEKYLSKGFAFFEKT